MSRTRRKMGGQPNNDNAVKHGCYVELSGRCLDGRTRTAKALSQIEAALTSSIGNDPSPQQLLIIQRSAVKAVRCALAEAAILDGSASESLEHDYLRWARELRSDLVALGLERRQRDVTDLQTYIEQQYGGQKGSKNE